MKDLDEIFERTDPNSLDDMVRFMNAIADELETNPEFNINIGLKMAISHESMEIVEKISKEVFGEEVIYEDVPVNIGVRH